MHKFVTFLVGECITGAGGDGGGRGIFLLILKDYMNGLTNYKNRIFKMIYQ